MSSLTLSDTHLEDIYGPKVTEVLFNRFHDCRSFLWIEEVDTLTEKLDVGLVEINLQGCAGTLYPLTAGVHVSRGEGLEHHSPIKGEVVN